MSIRRRTIRIVPAVLAALLCATEASAQAAPGAPFSIRRGDRIVFVGNTFAERMQLFPHFESLLTTLQPGDSLTFRNMGWSADEVALQPRPLNFGDMHSHLNEQRADVIFAAFGMNESYAGEAGLPSFRVALDTLLQAMQRRRYNGETPPRIVLLSPIAHERVERVPLDPAAHNRQIAAYTEAMRQVAASRGAHFVDLYTPTLPLMENRSLGDLTINGIHLNDRGTEIVSRIMARALGWSAPDPLAPARRTAADAQLTAAIRDKNQLFFYRWRAVNGEYIYGRRKEPFGVVNFPPEMQKLEDMIAAREKEIWRLARAVAGRPRTARAGAGR
ncbi:MAG: SGNH/GDSL hydrolase family protein [Gemmatimonadetes bacterium]|nr:SGNH/GDSL hydrolase family protein [Gemmatimonadota bacterium]